MDGYERGNKGFKVLAKSKKQTESLVRTMRIFSEDIGIQFGIKKCRVLIIERGKVIRTDGIRLPDG